MSPSVSTASFPTRVVHDASASRVELVVDVSPATIEDVTAAVGPRQVRIRVANSDGDVVRTVAPPTHRLEFGRDREAVYNNGILTVVVEVVEQ